MAVKQPSQGLLWIIIAAVVIIVGYLVLTMPDNRSTGDKIGDAVNELEDGGGLGDAADELKDRTPGERLGDAVEDVGDSIKNATDGR